MFAPESQALLRVMKTSRDIATAFASFCARQGAVVHGVRVATGRRGLRGIIAKKDLEEGIDVLRIPAGALIHVGTALADSNFRPLLSSSVPGGSIDASMLDMELRTSEMKIAGQATALRNQQIILAAYLAFVSQREQHALRPYTDFLPRHEGAFVPLMNQWLPELDASRLCANLERNIAHVGGATPSEVRNLILFFLAMAGSRQVPVRQLDWKQRILRSSSGTTTPTSAPTAGLSASELLSSIPPHQSGQRAPPDATEVAQAVACLPVLCPLIDLCNHSRHEENVAIDVDDADDGFVFRLVTTSRVHAGDELTMDYGVPNEQLKLMWGMPTVF